MASVGQELKRERELRGISLKDIADSSKINMRFLRALEDDQLNILPGKFFTKSTIRTYSNYLGLDEKSILNLYYETIHSKEQELNQVNEKKEKNKILLPKKVKNIFYSVIIFIIFLIILSSLFFILQEKEPPLPPEKPITSIITSEKIALPPSTLPALIEEEKELKLEIQFHLKTWIQVYADGRLILNKNMEPGDHFNAKTLNEFRFNIGNAGGFSYNINDKEAKSLGPPGKVIKDLTISLKNFKQFLKKQDSSKK